VTSLGRFAARPITSRNIPVDLADHIHGAQKLRTNDLDLTLRNADDA
jgi:hypothetical protein